jgi:hypothetical protein
MTLDEAIKTLKENLCGLCAYGSQNMESCDIISCDNRDAIKALEQEPCADAISRKAALEAILTRMPNFCGGEGGNLINRNETASYIRNLPSVTPKQKQETILDKIRAEIESKCCITVGRENDPAITLYDVFEIIDKYKAESEV